MDKANSEVCNGWENAAWAFEAFRRVAFKHCCFGMPTRKLLEEHKSLLREQRKIKKWLEIVQAELNRRGEGGGGGEEEKDEDTYSIRA